MQDVHCGSCAPAKKKQEEAPDSCSFCTDLPTLLLWHPEQQLGDLGAIFPLHPRMKHTGDNREHRKAFWKSAALLGDGQEQLCQTRSLSAGGPGDTAAKQSRCSCASVA